MTDMWVSFAYSERHHRPCLKLLQVVQHVFFAGERQTYDGIKTVVIRHVKCAASYSSRSRKNLLYTYGNHIYHHHHCHYY